MGNVEYLLSRNGCINKGLNKALSLSVDYLLTNYPKGVVKAVVLTGSMARGEGSAFFERDRLKSFSDMEMLVVFDDQEDMGLQRTRLKALSQGIRERLKGEGIICEVEYGPAPLRYFRKLKPHIFGIELKRHGKVVWGDKGVLDTIPTMDEKEIPKEDGWYLLSNRIIEQIKALDAFLMRRSFQNFLFSYSKMIVDLATSILIFTNLYRSSYRERAVLIEEGVKRIENPSLRKELSKLPETVRFWVDVRSNPLLLTRVITGKCRNDILVKWLELIPIVKKIWIWELNLLLGEEKTLDVERLLERLLLKEPLRRKIKGWAKLLLMPELSWDMALSKAALKNLFFGSPRYMTYAGSSLLYFHLPGLIGKDSSEKEEKVLNLVERYIPVRFGSPNGLPMWRYYGTELVKGWEVFLRHSGV